MTTRAKQILSNHVAELQAGDGQAIREGFAEDATWTLRAGELPNPKSA